MHRNKYQRQESSESDTFEPEIPGKIEEKRNAHTAAEQKRRDAIKGGLEQLQHLIPGCHQCEMPHGMVSKTSKAQVLQKAIEYVNYLTVEKEKKDAEIAEMEKKLVALKIVKDNYENLVKTSNVNTKPEVTDEMKFNVFRHLMGTLLESFTTSVSIGTFQSLSGTMISWLEEHCKPEVIKGVIVSAMRYILGIS